MTDDRVACAECGAMILAATATRNAGLCMPCKNGTREQMAKSRAVYERDKARRDSPERKHWSWLLDQASRAGHELEILSPANRMYFAVNCLGGDVYNGGFGQYFHNSASNHYAVALEGLKAMGALRTAELVTAAADIAFAGAPVPVSWSVRREMLWNGVKERGADWEARLESIDKLFYERAHEDELAECTDRFARRHGLYEGF